MPRRFAMIASSLAVAALLVGCGSDDDSSDGDDTTTTTAEEESTTTEEGSTSDPETEESTAPDDTTESTEAPDETTTTESVGEGPGDAEFCAAYAAFDESFDELPDETVEDIQAGADLVLDGLTAMAPVAPDELAEDMPLLVQGAEDLVAAVADATTVEEAQTAGGEIFNDPEFSAAAERVDTYFTERCPEANDDQADG
jgi:hypothetical protein